MGGVIFTIWLFLVVLTSEHDNSLHCHKRIQLHFLICLVNALLFSVFS